MRGCWRGRLGLPDGLYEHDGQLTKREMRAITLSALAPKRGQLLWDIGAGSGSIGIEWMLADPAMRAIAIEAEPERVGAHCAATRWRLGCRTWWWSKARRPMRWPDCRSQMRCSSAVAAASRACWRRPLPR